MQGVNNFRDSAMQGIAATDLQPVSEDTFSMLEGMAVDAPQQYGPTYAPMEVDSTGADAAGTVTSPGPDEERRLVEEADHQAGGPGLQADKHYFLISGKWYIEWKQWVGHPTATSPKMGPKDITRTVAGPKGRPGPINNADLLDADDLKKNINEIQDYELLAAECWQLLHSWYGGGPAVKRRAIASGSTVSVELYGVKLKLYVSSNLGRPTSIVESKTTTISGLKRRACEEFGLDYDKVRIWDFFRLKRHSNLELEGKLHKTLTECTIIENNDILLEVQQADGTWPPEEDISADHEVTDGTPPITGAVGLENLGNTCFMNSSIQCLSNVPVLREYFVSERYKEEINRDAFKTGGKLAESFSKLLRNIWNPTTVTVAPRAFKCQIGQFAEQFTGYRQHDSMEFIEYLLDGLKEDVNLVTGKKPSVELKEADGRPDDVVAAEAKEHYNLRNRGTVDDLFLGFYKSTVTCPEETCDRQSVKFDPFLSIKVPLRSAEEEQMQWLRISVVANDVTKISVGVPKFGNAADIVTAVAKETGLDRSNCVLTELLSGKIYKFFEDKDAVTTIRHNDILAVYDLGGPLTSDMCGAVIMLSRKKTQYYTKREFVGIPLLTRIPRNAKPSDVIKWCSEVSLDGAGQNIVHEAITQRLGVSCPDGAKIYWTQNKNSCDSTEDEIVEGGEALSASSTNPFNETGEYMYLVLEFPEGTHLPGADSVYERTKGACMEGGAAGSLKLEKCIEISQQTEKLGMYDTWYCNKCKDHREAFKKMELWSLPPVLVLQLKRFTYTEYSRDRLDTAVQFPLEGLDLAPHRLQVSAEPAVYDLAGMSLHMGGLGGGHYIAYARSSENGKWYCFNDSSCREVDASTVAGEQSGAYVLFYIRRDGRPASWGPPTQSISS